MQIEEQEAYLQQKEALLIKEAAEKKAQLIKDLGSVPHEKLATLYANLLEKSKDQQKDIKTMANTMYKFCLILGFVDENKNVTPGLNAGKIISKAGSIITSLMMPGASKQFEFALDLIPMLEKYKKSID